MITEKQKVDFIRLRAEGLSFDKISKQLKISKPTLIAISKDHEEEINNLKAIELEALQEEYSMLKKQRIKVLGEQLRKIISELNNRDFSDIPSSKLIESLNKLMSTIQKDTLDLTFKEEIFESLSDHSLSSMTKRREWKP